ncbi:MAG: hypothetical protein BIFFINMI_01993 [Phycisphaerae bacterium]|nr:hypothetical protein [Phycisphaerae bacterium]
MRRYAMSILAALALAAAPVQAAEPAAAGDDPPMAYPAPLPPTTQPERVGRVVRVPQDQPTLQAALDAAADGDTVLLSPGRYEGPATIGAKAVTLASLFLTTGDAGAIERTIIDGTGKRCALDVTDKCKPATRIVGLTLRGGSDGITCHARCEIRNNHFVGCGDGVDYEGGGGVCRDNVFDDCRDDALDLDGDCAVRMEHNVLRNCHDDGIEIRYYPYDAATPVLEIVVRDNLIVGSGEDGIQVIDHPGPSRRMLWIERNVIRSSAKAAIAFMDNADTREDYRGAAVTDPAWIINNTLIGGQYGLVGGGNVVAINNVLAGFKHEAARRVGGRSILSHNLFFDNGVNWADSNIDAATTLTADPRLDAGGAPTAGSPCLGAGTSVVRRGGATILSLPPGAPPAKAPTIGALPPPPATDP